MKCVFHKEKLNAIDTVYEKHAFDHLDLQWEFDLLKFEKNGEMS